MDSGLPPDVGASIQPIDTGPWQQPTMIPSGLMERVCLDENRGCKLHQGSPLDKHPCRRTGLAGYLFAIDAIVAS